MGRKPKNAESIETNQNMITDPTGEMIDASRLAICKLHPDCFSCVDGYCTALHARYVGKACSFYKNREKCIAENRQVYERLKENGRYDLIDQYGDTLAALGAFDAEMDCMEQMEREMNEFQQRDLLEREAASGGQ